LGDALHDHPVARFGERDKLGEATPRAPQGPEPTAARTSASCVDDDHLGVAVVEIGAVA
jgi:hypothetical protein